MLEKEGIPSQASLKVGMVMLTKCNCVVIITEVSNSMREDDLYNDTFPPSYSVESLRGRCKTAWWYKEEFKEILEENYLDRTDMEIKC